MPLSPEELAAGYQRWLGRDSQALTMNKAEIAPLYQDIYLIAPMVVYLGHTNKHPPKVNPTDAELLGNPEEQGHYYRCKHLDPKTRDCTIYEIRPAMCRGYPYNNECNYARCTWKSRKAKKQTSAQLRKRKRALTAEVEEPRK